MSILLEALRKSEKSKHPQQVPDIHTADQSGLAAESMQAGPLALLLVAALFASGWFIWHQYRLPAGSYQAPLGLAENKVSAVTPTVANPVAGVEEIPEVVPLTPVADNSGGKQRTPVESYQQEVNITSPPAVGKSQPSTASTPVNGIAKDSASPSATRTAAAGKQVAPGRKKPRTREPALITYWELPDAVRASVPEIKYTVLVYDQQPRDRFVLINGERLGEGDSFQAGLVVEEIRREGVVFSYRLYRFLVER